MRIGILLITLVCFPLASASLWAQGPPAAADQQWKTHISTGISLLRQQKFDLAKQQFLLATQRANTRGEGFVYLGLACLNLGQQREAEQAFRQALLLEPRSAQAHYNLGLIYSTQNKRSEAIQELKQAVALAPRHLDGLYNLGVLLLERNDALEAAQYLERAAQLGPARVELSANLIRAYLGAGRSEQAIKQAQLDSSRFERSPEFHLALGNAFLAHNFPGPARAYLEKASRQVSCDATIQLPLANANLRMGDAARAFEALQCLSGKATSNPEYYFFLAQTQILLDRKEDALNAIHQAIQLDPGNSVYLLTLGRVYQKHGEQRKAVEILEKAAKLHPNFPEIPYSIAISYFIADEYEIALRYLDTAVRLDPEFDRAYFLLGIIKTAQSHFVEAESFLNKALNLSPDNPFYHCIYGMAQFAQQRFPEAIQSFQRALSLNPSYGLGYYQLGRALTQQSRLAEARQALEKAIELRPDLAEAHYRLGRVYARLGEKEKAEKVMATFQRLSAVEMTERQEMLKSLREVVQPDASPKKSGG